MTSTKRIFTLRGAVRGVLRPAVLALVAGGSTVAAAQEPMPAMDHSTMDHSTMDHSTMTPPSPTHTPATGPAAPAASASSAVPVGSLPSSDGSTGRSYAEYGIDAHTMNTGITSSLTLDKFGLTHNRDGKTGLEYDGDFWVGNATDKLWIKSEGERIGGQTEDAKVEAYWSHAISPFWDAQVGARRDFGAGVKRNWAALGVQGTAPYGIETEITAYAGASGRTLLYLHGEHDIALTQKLIFTPELEANIFGKNDKAFGVGSGLSDVQATLTLRYEATPHFAPYIGVAFDRKLGRTATYASAQGESRSSRNILAGVRLTF
ncbi:copper resistance protein B [Alcaligenaceae bacterium A4P071]|nr:copper resistance protein B [Alcaligenaceae bacterium A4P071]